MYTPHVGRWISEDPSGFVDGPNAYLYVKNNPANTADPSGKQVAKEDEEKQDGKGCAIKVCKRPIRDSGFGQAFGHIYIVIDIDGKPTLFTAGPYDPSKTCNISGDQLRVATFPWNEEAIDWPKSDEERAQHRCTKYLVGPISCQQLDNCLLTVGARIRDCCIPYSAAPKLFAKDGCNSNCAAFWLLEQCLKGQVLVEGKEGPPKKKDAIPSPPSGFPGTPGWGKGAPDCVKKPKDEKPC